MHVETPERLRPRTATTSSIPGVKTAVASDLPRRVGMVRIAFGLVWAIAAWYKWQPAFRRGFANYFTRAAKGQPAWVDSWAHFWRTVVVPHSAAFYAVTVGVETLIALSLILGIARRPLYLLGGLFSFMVWSTAESFGRFWSAGQTDLGTSIMYVFVFAALFVLDRAGGARALALDGWIEQRLPWWRHIADP
jgi:thiosulfate dehydrogenase [quinone] large subunit